MEEFKDFIKRYAGPASVTGADRQMLRLLTAQYPWFTTARMLRDDERVDPLLGLYLLSRPAPSYSLYEVSPDDEAAAVKSEESIIDRFLTQGEHRIVPDENAPDFDAAESSSTLEITDEMLSEELAAIYRAQGLDSEADEIMRRLERLGS